MLHLTTPAVLTRRSDFYHQLGVMLGAGISVREALNATRHIGGRESAIALEGAL